MVKKGFYEEMEYEIRLKDEEIISYVKSSRNVFRSGIIWVKDLRWKYVRIRVKLVWLEFNV